MKWRSYLIIFLIIVILGNSPVYAQTFDMPDKIEVTAEEVNYSFFKGKSSAVLRNGGWSTLREFHGGILPNLLHLNKIDFSEVFAGIDFSSVNTWQFSENSTYLIADTSRTDIVVTVTFGDTEIVFEYFGYIERGSMECNVEDACDFMFKLSSLLFSFDTQAMITMPSFPSFYLIIILIISILFPYRLIRSLDSKLDRKRIIIDGFLIFLSIFLPFTVLLSFQYSVNPFLEIFYFLLISLGVSVIYLLIRSN